MSASTVVTVDLVILRGKQDNQREVLLVLREKEPYKHMWALPGGKLEATDETLEEAAMRELYEETGVSLSVDYPLVLIGAYGDTGRDPRGRFISLAYLSLLATDIEPKPTANDVQAARWFPVAQIGDMQLAFDHTTILTDGLFAFVLNER